MVELQNALLAALPSVIRERWRPSFGLCEYRKGDALTLGRASRFIYFPLTCVVITERQTDSGDRVFMRFTGANFAIGLVDALKLGEAPFATRVCGAGHAITVPRKVLFDSLEPEFIRVVAQTLAMSRLAEGALQLAHCARSHDAAQRLARALAEADDCFGPRRSISLTHQELSDIVVVRRETVTSLLLAWAAVGTVRLARGSISILDRPALRSLACDCYRSVQKFNGQELPMWRGLPWVDSRT